MVLKVKTVYDYSDLTPGKESEQWTYLNLDQIKYFTFGQWAETTLINLGDQIQITIAVKPEILEAVMNGGSYKLARTLYENKTS